MIFLCLREPVKISRFAVKQKMPVIKLSSIRQFNASMLAYPHLASKE